LKGRITVDELDLLATARPVPAPSTETVSAARSGLLALIAAEPPTRSKAVASDRALAEPRRHWTRRLRMPRRILIPAIAAGVALALGLGLGLGVPWDGTSGPDVNSPLVGDAGPLPPVKLRNLLLAAADRSAQDGQSSGRHWVSKIESGQLMQVGSSDNKYAIMGRSDHTTWYSVRRTDPTRHYQQWIGGAPASDADRAAWQRAGAPSSWPVELPPNCKPKSGYNPSPYTTGSGPARVVVTKPGVSTFRIAEADLTAAQVSKLPTDPARLKDWAVKAIRGSTEIRTHAELNKALFDAMLNLLYQSPSTPAVRAAAYRLLAELPGVRDRGAVTDPLGRAGVAFTFNVNEEQSGVRMADTGGPQEVRLIFDPESGQPLAWETHQLQPVDYLSWVPAGALFSYQAVVQTRWTDEAPPKVSDVRSENWSEQFSC
jgi:hypothetical protein